MTGQNQIKKPVNLVQQETITVQNVDVYTPDGKLSGFGYIVYDDDGIHQETYSFDGKLFAEGWYSLKVKDSRWLAVRARNRQ